MMIHRHVLALVAVVAAVSVATPGGVDSVAAFSTLAGAAISGFAERAGSSTRQSARQPAPLRGVALGHGSRLRLLVAENPPFLLDVDSGTVTALAGLPALERGVHSVVAVGGRSAAVVAGYHDAQLYGVRGRSAHVSSLGSGSAVTPASGGRGLWVKSYLDRSHCALREVGLDGRQLRAPRAFACATTTSAGGSLGLVVNRTRVIDPRSGRTLLRTRRGIVAVAGRSLLLWGPGRGFTLLDPARHGQRRLPWPSVLSGGDDVVVDPRGRLVALAFADPAWPGGGQALDVWLLNTKSGTLTQLPGMPALVALKFTSMRWTDDGRLLLLARSGGKDVVAAWRPGQKQLALKRVRLPPRSGASDSFAPLR